jgi:hypothetical protein
MSEIIQQADELRARAITILVAERALIDERLTLLGYDGTAPGAPAGGRRAKTCSACGGENHTARTCANRDVAAVAPREVALGKSLPL